MNKDWQYKLMNMFISSSRPHGMKINHDEFMQLVGFIDNLLKEAVNENKPEETEPTIESETEKELEDQYWSALERSGIDDAGYFNHDFVLKFIFHVAQRERERIQGLLQKDMPLFAERANIILDVIKNPDSKEEDAEKVGYHLKRMQDSINLIAFEEKE